MTTKERNCQAILRGARGLVGAGCLCLGAITAHAAPELNPVKPRVIALDFAVGQAGKRSVVTADGDLVLQATNAKGYRMGRYVAAYAVENLHGPPLWQTDHFGALAHGPLRLGDLNGDGRDEVCGYTIRNDWTLLLHK